MECSMRLFHAILSRALAERPEIMGGQYERPGLGLESYSPPTL